MHKEQEKPLASIQTMNSNVKEHLGFCQSTKIDMKENK
jgi:hypothetical protein